MVVSKEWGKNDGTKNTKQMSFRCTEILIQTTKMNNYIIFGDQKSLEENNELKYQNNNSSKEPGIVANPSKL